MRKLKHLPLEQWPEADHEAFRIAYEPGDIFDDNCGPGAHHSAGWRKMVRALIAAGLVLWPSIIRTPCWSIQLRGSRPSTCGLSSSTSPPTSGLQPSP